MREHNDDPFPVGCRVTEEHPKWGDGAPMLCGEEVWFRASEYTDDPNDSDSWWAAHIIMIHPDEITVGWVDEHGEEGTFEAHRSDLHRVRPLSAHLTRIDSEPDPADPESSAVAKAAPEGSDPGPTTGQALLGEPTSPLRGSSQHTTAPAPESSPDGEGERLTDTGHVIAARAAVAQATVDVLAAERDALAARLAAWPEVPDGHEVLVVPSEVVDAVRAARSERDFAQVWSEIDIAASAAVARRPKPEARLEWVPWWETQGRRHVSGPTIVEVGRDLNGPWIRVTEDGKRMYSLIEHGTVEVLAEDGES